jgi:hypothetical protein
MTSGLRALFVSELVIILALFSAAAMAQTVGQISGVATMPSKGTVAGATVQLRDLTTKQVIGTAKTNASGQFVFVVDHPGNFVIEILDEKGNVVGTTAPVVLAPGAMVVSAIAVSPTAGGAAAGAAGAAGAAAAQGEQSQGQGQGSTTAAGAIAGGGVSGNIFMPSLPSVSSAATGSGVAAGTVPSRGTASPSR